MPCPPFIKPLCDMVQAYSTFQSIHAALQYNYRSNSMSEAAVDLKQHRAYQLARETMIKHLTAKAR